MKTHTAESIELQKRQELLDAGRQCGLTAGLATVSLDHIAQITHISKRTLYKYYGTRDEFFVALIQHDGDVWREWFFDAVRERANTPLKRFLGFFELLSDLSVSPTFTGCLFAQVLSNPLIFSELWRQAAKEQLALVRQFLQKNAQQAGVRNATAVLDMVLCPTILLLSDGGNQVCPVAGPRLRELVNLLLQDNIQLEEV